MVLEQQFSWNCFKHNSIFFHLSPTSSHLHPLQVENCDSNSRLVVDEDDNSKLRLERVKPNTLTICWIYLPILSQYVEFIYQYSHNMLNLFINTLTICWIYLSILSQYVEFIYQYSHNMLNLFINTLTICWIYLPILSQYVEFIYYQCGTLRWRVIYLTSWHYKMPRS